MTLDLDDLPRRLRERSPRHRVQWRRAWRALRALLADADATRHAFEVSYALDGDVARRRLERFVAHAEGRRLLFERPSLLAALSDRESLARMPQESLGRAYLAHMDRYGFDPAKLPELRRQTDPVKHRDEVTEWFLERTDLTHDLWHVLTGYGADFTTAQLGGRSNAFLSVGAGLESWRRIGGGWPRYLWRAWRRGRRAAPLDVLPWEALLPLPLDDVRRAVGVEPPEVVHPDGIIEQPPEAQAA
jgi:ubiquinone biosynthesis protein COQ4